MARMDFPWEIVIPVIMAGGLFTTLMITLDPKKDETSSANTSTQESVDTTTESNPSIELDVIAGEDTIVTNKFALTQVREQVTIYDVQPDRIPYTSNGNCITGTLPIKYLLTKGDQGKATFIYHSKAVVEKGVAEITYEPFESELVGELELIDKLKGDRNIQGVESEIYHVKGLVINIDYNL